MSCEDVTSIICTLTNINRIVLLILVINIFSFFGWRVAFIVINGNIWTCPELLLWATTETFSTAIRTRSSPAIGSYVSPLKYTLSTSHVLGQYVSRLKNLCPFTGIIPSWTTNEKTNIFNGFLFSCHFLLFRILLCFVQIDLCMYVG